MRTSQRMQALSGKLCATVVTNLTVLICFFVHKSLNTDYTHIPLTLQTKASRKKAEAGVQLL